MRKIKFDKNEKTLLREIIESGLKESNNYYSFELKDNIYKKLPNDILVINTKELQFLTSYTQSLINSIEDLILEINQKFYGNDPSLYFFVDEICRHLMFRIDTIFSIKEKLTKEKHFYYKNVFENIERIRHADNFYISLSDNKPYKIAIINNGSVLEWNFTTERNFEEKEFLKLTKQKEKDLKINYKSNVNRIQIHEIFKNYIALESEKNFQFLRYLFL